MRILITSIGTATSVNLVRYFHKLQDYVVGVDINPLGYTAGSLLVDKFEQIVLATNESYISDLQNIVRKEEIDLLIPVNDIEVYEIAKNIDKISCRTIIPDICTIERGRDKYICSKMMMNYGIPVPTVLENDSDEKRIVRERIGVGSRGITIVERNEKTPFYKKEDAFLQKYVDGEEYTVDVLCDGEGCPLYIVPRQRIEVKSGVATKVCVTQDNKLIDYVKRILEKVKLPGFSNIQFIKDANGMYWFIEINCRFAGCGAATLAVANNYLSIFKSILFDEKKRFPLNEDVKWNSIVTRYYEEVVYENSIS